MGGEMQRVEKFNRLINELHKVTEKYGLRWMGATFDSENNIRTIIIADDELDRDEVLEMVTDCNHGFEALVANKYVEEELN
jgi:hypothetical protein